MTKTNIYYFLFYFEKFLQNYLIFVMRFSFIAAIHTAACHRADGVRFDCYRRRYVLHELPRLLWRDT